MTPFEQRGEAILSRLVRFSHPKVAEIGVLRGVLSAHLLGCRADLHLLMIDSWAPGTEQPERYKATGDDHANHEPAKCEAHYTETLNRISRFDDRARVMRMRSIDAAAQIADGSLDLVFLDADHSYAGVREDLNAWMGKVRKGGFIGGHDYRNPDPRFHFGVEQAVDEWAAIFGHAIELDRNFTWFARLT